MYVLLIWLVAGGGITTAEFRYKTTCEAAGQAVLSSIRTKDPRYSQGTNVGNYVCVQK